jgi:hypothetical protein
MPSNPDRLPELITVDEGDPAAAWRIRRIAAEGRLRRLYAGIYTSNLDSPIEAIVLRHWQPICSRDVQRCSIGAVARSAAAHCRRFPLLAAQCQRIGHAEARRQEACRPFHPQRLMSFLSEPWPGVIRARGTMWLATRMDWRGELSRAGAARRYRGISAWWASLLEGRSVDPRQAEEFTGIPWDPLFGDRRQELAFVGIGMDEQALSASLDACLLTGEEMRQSWEVWHTYYDPFPRWETPAITPNAANYH